MVLENNGRTQLGGRCGSFVVNVENVGTFRHERGPSLLLLEEEYKRIFADCSNKTTQSYGLEMKKYIPAYQVVFEDGDTISLGFPRSKCS